MDQALDLFDDVAWEREMGSARGTRLGPVSGLAQLGYMALTLEALEADPKEGA